MEAICDLGNTPIPLSLDIVESLEVLAEQESFDGAEDNHVARAVAHLHSAAEERQDQERMETLESSGWQDSLSIRRGLGSGVADEGSR